MLEKLWVEKEREEDFTACFGLSMVFGLISIFIARFFVPFQLSGDLMTGIVAVVLTSLAASYPLIKYLEEEVEETEEKERTFKGEFDLLERHGTELEIYVAFFLGVALAFGLGNSFFPEMFEVQREVIGSVRPDVAAGKVTSPGLFVEVITNNLSIFFITFLLSFLLTAGMIFILVWNASIFGVFISEISKGLMDIPYIVISYLPHGILEISAYIIAGLSGFFLSHEVKEIIEWDDKSQALKLMADSFLLIGLGIGALVVAGIIESIGV